MTQNIQIQTAGIMQARTVLAVGAHPDDIEFSCMGLLLRLKKAGSDVTVFLASNGSEGDPTSSQERIKESRKALEILNAHFLYEDSPGIKPSDHERLAVRIRNIILEIRPELILVHSEHDTHQEHRYLREIVMTASRRHRCSILSYKSVSATISYRENLVVDVSEELQKKIESIQQHKSQLHHEYLQEGQIRAFHTNWFAVMRGCKYVESYYLEQGIM